MLEMSYNDVVKSVIQSGIGVNYPHMYTFEVFITSLSRDLGCACAWIWVIMLFSSTRKAHHPETLTLKIPFISMYIYCYFIVKFNDALFLRRQLSQWLWLSAIQRALNDFMAMRNAYHARKDNNKAGPSGCSRNESFVLHADYGLKNCLLPLTDDQLRLIAEIKEHMGGEQLLAFVTPKFAARAAEAYDALGVTELTIYNAWHVFEALLLVLQ